jgi:hypothetical protein
VETVVERPAALDVHKAQVTACVRGPDKGGRREQHVQEFATTVRGLLALRDWLAGYAVTQVVMEATGVYWKAPWAIRDAGGAIADFQTGYSNPAMARMIGVPTEASMGRRLLEEAPGFGEDKTFMRMRGVLESGRPDAGERRAAPARATDPRAGPQPHRRHS